ncbi:amidohydrolase family protein [Nocardia sp.]|uniref:amidohydrolase family protein n=1 Tax=Nocardia sp. TaxID=1821 RepID=UPI002614E5FE|nr:amidohydrolase family protein [Nocardia sp.]
MTYGLIAAVGTDKELRPTARDVGAREIDLAGRALLPGFIDAHHHFLFAALDRRSTDLRLRTLVTAGVQLAGSSDYPSGDYRVLPAIQAAVTRRARSRVVYSPEEAITVGQALRAYTMGSADALGVSDIAGSIAVGKQADLVVINRNPVDVEPEHIGSLTVEETYVAGACVYRAHPQQQPSQQPSSS